MILSRFRWYRRARGGYWAQVTAPLRIFTKTRWFRCDGLPAPLPGHYNWEFYPWASKTMGNGYIDEWHSVDPCYAVPFSKWLAETIGTNDAACILGLILSARKAHEVWASAHHPDGDEGTKALADLRLALIPFKDAKP